MAIVQITVRIDSEIRRDRMRIACLLGKLLRLRYGFGKPLARVYDADPTEGCLRCDRPSLRERLRTRRVPDLYWNTPFLRDGADVFLRVPFVLGAGALKPGDVTSRDGLVSKKPTIGDTTELLLEGGKG